uniref:PHD finger protein 7 n=1 Tax=Pelusios castaneus TaxID=367368 RepID=A0A8C8VLM5_9SAUR
LAIGIVGRSLSLACVFLCRLFQCLYECASASVLQYHASGLIQRGKDEEGFYGFLYPDIQQEIKRAGQKTCCVCGCKGASTSCQGRKCTKTFHFPCGAERGCIYHFFGEFKSFCWKHRPVQRVGRRRQQGETICVICLESMVGKPSYGALVCPACKHSWFHRACIQGHALRAALYHFRCPRCRDMETFQREMFRMGIKIPDRSVSFAPFQRASHLYALQALAQPQDMGWMQGPLCNLPWKLLLCNSCGSYGTHRRCSALGNTTSTWECENCAGPESAPEGI